MRVAAAARLSRSRRRGAGIVEIMGEMLEGRGDCWCGECSVLAGTGGRPGSRQAGKGIRDLVVSPRSMLHLKVIFGEADAPPVQPLAGGLPHKDAP